MTKEDLISVRGPVKNWNARQTSVLSYSVFVSHDGLKEKKELKSRDPSVLQSKLDQQVQKWDEKYQALLERRAKQRNAEQAETDTQEAARVLEECECLLQATLDVDDAVDWSHLRTHPEFRQSKGSLNKVKYNGQGEPVKFDSYREPSIPEESDPEFRSGVQWYHKLIPGLAAEKEEEAVGRWKKAMSAYESEVSRVKEKNDDLRIRFEDERTKYFHARDKYDLENSRKDKVIAELEESWRKGDPEAIHEHSEMVLNNSKYPDWVNVDFELGYRPDERMLVLNYELPSPDSVPTLKEVRYVKTRDEFVEKHITEAQKKALYDRICYQIALRTLHEIWEADEPDNIQGIVFNGFVTAIDKATGIEGRSCILSVQAWKEEFLAIKLELVDPKECFRRLKGVSASSLAAVQAVPPKIKLDFEDSRFVESREVVGGVDEGTNLAAMHWEEFEHLIREIFANEFSGPGAEVKVTKGSRDGGVDAIALDPDPIRGGKIVIQAKRYTNTVGVSAVRDLYGTVVNENANRGILVTTSHYGPDAYQFADGKNLTLIDGGGLLDLLAKHGQKASIDIKAARLLLSDMDLPRCSGHA
ncbi:restriction endonuclease [Marinobacter sp.]|uniref:restriction endonuclease n=1 Tax=Marinobacter sp. TaxID=50741 RepID=UPI000C4E1011|nr:restriction endonuclease [Marinobacter sp.]MBE97186.1 restriction endonuclease [Marinobacter sp.]|tara:strand:+ start:469 stop:2226 length:1758 start_codon:yes stop_codon:yes gene_type:complete